MSTFDYRSNKRVQYIQVYDLKAEYVLDKDSVEVQFFLDLHPQAERARL